MWKHLVSTELLAFFSTPVQIARLAFIRNINVMTVFYCCKAFRLVCVGRARACKSLCVCVCVCKVVGGIPFLFHVRE